MKALVVAALLVPSFALAQVPQKIGYQGRLLKADGTPESGSKALTFQLFDALTGGTSQWTETQTVGLVDGFYSVALGEVTAFPASLFDGRELFLELTVGGNPLSPRQKVSSVPYALLAGGVEGPVNATTLSVNGTQIVDATGKLTGPALAAGPGIKVANGTVSLLSTCNAGEVLKAGANGAWACAADATGSGGTTLTAAAGSGLTISGSAITVTTTGCANNQLLRYTTANGWACSNETTSSGGVTTLQASAPLTGNISGSSLTLGLPAASATQDGYLAKADFAAFSAKRTNGGENLFDIVKTPTRWAQGGTVAGVATINTTDERMGEGSFSFDHTAQGTVTWTYGDYVPVDPTNTYLASVDARLATGAGTFSAGLEAYGGNKNVLGTRYFIALNVTVPATWTEYAARIGGEGTGANQFPVGTRFVRLVLRTNEGNVGSTLVDAIELTRVPTNCTWRRTGFGAPLPYHYYFDRVGGQCQPGEIVNGARFARGGCNASAVYTDGNQAAPCASPTDGTEGLSLDLYCCR